MKIKSLQILCLLQILFVSVSCSQSTKYISEIENHRAEKNAEFKNPEKTALKAKDLKKFKGLNYFEIDSTFKVIAKLVLTPDAQVFEMPTSTERLPKYRQYGVLHFEIKGKKLQLNVYQNIDLMKKPGYEDYLFIPFTDETTGDETYGAGRFIEARIPNSNEMILDFNLCFNPYCAYNDRYSCPIPPVENHLKIKILAGEKTYEKH